MTPPVIEIGDGLKVTRTLAGSLLLTAEHGSIGLDVALTLPQARATVRALLDQIAVLQHESLAERTAA